MHERQFIFATSKGHDHEAMPRLPQPQSLRKGWEVHESQSQQASRQASDEVRQEGLLRLT
jgi:hypothetical protein